MLEDAGNYDKRDWQPAKTARRFECGSPNMLGAAALEASLALLEEVGLEQVATLIEARVAQLHAGIAALPNARLLSPGQAERRAGILTFTLGGQDNAEVFEALKKEQLVCAQRGGGIRLSPHFYTPETVIEETLALLRQLA